MCNKCGKDCNTGIDDVQATLLTVLFEKQLRASENTLSASENNRKASENYKTGNRYFFFGMIFFCFLFCVSVFAWFTLHDFEMEIIEEEETYSIEQDATSNGSNNASQIITGDVTHGETENN